MTYQHVQLQVEIETKLEEIIDEVFIPHRDSTSEETFIECVLCEGWDEHDPNCPIPAIDKWINSQS